MTADDAWLVAIDLQHVFGDVDSPWGCSQFGRAVEGTVNLLPAFVGRTVLTRFVAPAEPAGVWIPYYADWPFALVSEDDRRYDLVSVLAGARAPVVTATTFGKWGAELEAATQGAGTLVLTGVATDCCVLSTALAAADAGIAVRVVADACAGASETDHQRALDAMGLYAPLITVTTVAEVLEHRRGPRSAR